MRNMKLKLKAVFIILYLPSFYNVAFSQEPAFDCEKASNYVENTICKTSYLSAIDYKMNALYRSVFQSAENQDAIKFGQIEWLSRRNSCENPSCINITYQERYDFLIGVMHQQRRLRVKEWRESKCVTDEFMHANNRGRHLPSFYFKVSNIDILLDSGGIDVKHTLYSNCPVENQGNKIKHHDCGYKIYEQVNNCSRQIFTSEHNKYALRDGVKVIDKLPSHMPAPIPELRLSMGGYKYIKMNLPILCDPRKAANEYLDTGIAKTVRYYGYSFEAEAYRYVGDASYNLCRGVTNNAIKRKSNFGVY